jgi:hypothetical protein
MFGWCFIADFAWASSTIFFAWASSPILLGLHRQFCSGFIADLSFFFLLGFCSP